MDKLEGRGRITQVRRALPPSFTCFTTKVDLYYAQAQ